MKPRLNPYMIAPDLAQLMIDFGQKVQALGLEQSLIHLVEVRASQINGCAVCLDLHSCVALKHGETPERIYMLDAWRESPLYSARERAALAWTEALTRLCESGAPDDVYEQLAAEFTPEEQVKLTLMINVINGFNRFGVGFRVPPLSADAPLKKAA